MTLGEHILRKLIDNYQISDEEALGIAKWLLWIRMEGEY